MQITDAIRTADTEHVVYFLLTAYVETLAYCDPLRSVLPEDVKRLPMAGCSDVAGRLQALRTWMERYASSCVRFVIEEVVEVFRVALQRIRTLQNGQQFLSSSPFRAPLSATL